MSYPIPSVKTFISTSAAIPRGHAVKPTVGDNQRVTISAAATDKHIGIANSIVDAAGQFVEVCIPGGGAKAKLGGTVAAGDLLTSDAAGKLVATTTANDKVIAQALEAGVLNDLIAVNVVIGNY